MMKHTTREHTTLVAINRTSCEDAVQGIPMVPAGTQKYLQDDPLLDVQRGVAGRLPLQAPARRRQKVGSERGSRGNPCSTNMYLDFF